MTQLALATPLLWPDQRSKTPTSQRAPGSVGGFKPDMGYAEAIRYIREIVADKDYERAILYTCFENIENEQMRRKVDNASGASLLLGLQGREYLLASDGWTLTPHNIYAIYLTLHNIHQMEKWGVGSLEMLLKGFSRKENITAAAALKGNAIEPWMEVLGLGPSAKLTDANATYRARAKEMANDQAALMNLNQAIEEARKVLRE